LTIDPGTLAKAGAEHGERVRRRLVGEIADGGTRASGGAAAAGVPALSTPIQQSGDRGPPRATCGSRAGERLPCGDCTAPNGVASKADAVAPVGECSRPDT